MSTIVLYKIPKKRETLRRKLKRNAKLLQKALDRDNGLLYVRNGKGRITKARAWYGQS